VLPADDDPGGAGAWSGFLGSVLVLVVSVQEVGVAGLLVGGVYGHRRSTRLLQVEDVRVMHHAGAPD
jgi:hypothetical protein